MEKSGPATEPGRPGASRRRTALAAIMLAGGGLLAAYALLWDGPAAFASALDHGDRLLGDLHDVYLPMARAVWSEPVRPVANFFYSAFFALLLAPLGLLTEEAAAWLWGGLQALVLAALWLVPARTFLRGDGVAAAGYGLLLLASQPVLHNLAWGQVSVLMTAGMLASMAALAAGRSATAGALLAGVTAIKYYPAILLVCFLARRDGRALAGFGVGLLALWALLPAAVLGPAPWLELEAGAMTALSRSGWVHGDINSQYVAHVARRWLSGAGWTAAGGGPSSAIPVLGGMAVAAGCGLLAWRLQSRPGCRDTALATAALVLSLPFLLRTSWPHYFVGLPFCQVVLLGRLRARRPGSFRRGAWTIPVLVSIALASVPALLAAGHWTAYSRSGALLVADALLLIPLAALAFRPAAPASAPGR